MPHTAELVVVDPHEGHTLLLAAIVQHAPYLKMFAIRHHTFRWRPVAHELLVSALSRLERLKSLEITSASFHALLNTPGFGAVENLSVLWDIAAIEERRAKVCISFRLLAIRADSAEIRAR